MSAILACEFSGAVAFSGLFALLKELRAAVFASGERLAQEVSERDREGGERWTMRKRTRGAGAKGAR
jgi:hypothetical protein